MNSISIISGVAARINYLKNEPNKQPKSWSDEVEQLLQRIYLCLKAADQETKQSEQFVTLEKKIVQQSYDIDDALAAMALRIPLKPKGKFSSKFGCLSVTSSEADLVRLKNELARLTNDLEDITKKTCGLEKPKENFISPAQTSHQEANPVSPKTPTGEDPLRMENEVREALSRQDLSVVSICGQDGMGKTTLAKKVYHHPEVRRSFHGFAWVTIHKECGAKWVLMDILRQLLHNNNADLWEMNEIQLTEEILTIQKQKRCLFVLDDIGTAQDWQNIRVALLIGNSSKILITTPSKEVAKMATSKDGVSYGMKPLTEAECFNILKEKASFDDHELQTVGNIIFRLSQGSRLFAVILGKCLKAENAVAADQLALELDYFRSQNSEGEKQVLELCYHKLPDELKPCLLYMGQFPKGKDIEVEKLHLLLAAEDLISPEDSLSNILEKLAFRELVEVQEEKGSMSRMYKYCRLHDQIRDFCVIKGLDEEFFKIVDFKNGRKEGPSTRRLAIYLDNYKEGHAIQFSSQDMMKKLRSLLIFDTYGSQEKSTWPSEINDLKKFSHLRVLYFHGVDFSVRNFPRGMDKLVFLRYLSFRGCELESKFPLFISKFLLLETLDLRVYTGGSKMTIPNVLSTMKRLRHLYFPWRYESDDNAKLQLSGLESLETLVNFDTGACDVNDLFQLKNLQILETISGGKHKDLYGIIKFLDEAAANLQKSSLDIRNFDCYKRDDRATIFKKLLECKYINSLEIEGQIGRLPEDVAISPYFTRMTFDGSEIEEDPVNALGKLPNLQDLTLLNDAFIVKEILFSDASKFPNLRGLAIQNLQYLEKLTFGKGAMPKLSTLIIEKCDYLKEVSIPEELLNRPQLAQETKEDDFYWVEPLLNIIHDN